MRKGFSTSHIMQKGMKFWMSVHAIGLLKIYLHLQVGNTSTFQFMPHEIHG